MPPGRDRRQEHRPGYGTVIEIPPTVSYVVTRPMPAFDLDTYVERSRAVDLSTIDWAEVPRHPVPPETIRTLRYMQDIESHTIIYLRALLATRAIDDPEVATFLACWVYEETFHGIALARFLEAAGAPVGPRPTPRGQESFGQAARGGGHRHGVEGVARLLRGAHDVGGDQRADHAHRLPPAGTGVAASGADRAARPHRPRRVAPLLLLLPPGGDPHAAAAPRPASRASWWIASGRRWAAASSPTRSCASWPPTSSPGPRDGPRPARSTTRYGAYPASRPCSFWRRGWTAIWRTRTAPRHQEEDAMATAITERPTDPRRPSGHYRAYTPRPFTRAERDSVTVLFGGLHWRVERILQAVLESAGHKAQVLPVATKDDLLTGREVADIGQCCPTSFTTGNLVNFLKKEAKAIGAAEVNEQVRLPHRRLLRRVPLRPVPPELRAGAAQLRARRLPHVPPRPGPARPEGGDGRRPRSEPAGHPRLPVGHLLHRPGAGPRVPGAALRGGARADRGGGARNRSSCSTRRSGTGPRTGPGGRCSGS